MTDNCKCIYCSNNHPFDIPKELIEAAINEELIIFCGAGISTESKSVLPFSFYDNISEILKVEYSKDLDNNLSFSGLMSLFCSTVPNGRRKLIKKIKERFDYIESFDELYNASTRFHREIAKIPNIRTIITTNWDDYFETECSATPIVHDKDVSLWNLFDRRVIKIHGSINNIGSIVATNEDYNKCYELLSKKPIGDRLKSILASKSIVFIGFSFGDEDLNKIIEILMEDLGDYSNQFYLVTIDEKWKTSHSKNIIPIITDGTYFINQIYEMLKLKQILYTSELYDFAEVAAKAISDLHHNWMNRKDFISILNDYPELFLSIVYQDGLIQGYKHCSSNRRKGTYLKVGYLSNVIYSYSHYITERRNQNLLIHTQYLLGYMNSLISVLDFAENEKITQFPGSFAHEEENFSSIDDLIEYISKLPDNRETLIQCKEAVLKYVSDSLVPHYRPWYI